MTTPALLRLREARPRTHVTLLTHEKLADLWRHHPAVDEVVPFPEGAGILDVARRIRAGRVGAGILFPNSPRSALELWMGGVPRRIGVATPLRRVLLTHPVARPTALVPMRKRSSGEIRRLLNRPIPSGELTASRFPPEAHHLHHYLHLVAVLGANRQPVPPNLVVAESEVRDAAKKFAAIPVVELDRNRPGADAIFGICPGAEYGGAKRWPAESFVAAAREVSRQTACRWIVFGGPRETRLAGEVAAGIGDGALSLAGMTSLRELMALLKLCRVLLTNDTGPMHLAAAVGTRVVAVFGSTSPDLTGPGLPGIPPRQAISSNVACSPCFLRECPIDFRCMKSVSVPQVVNAILESQGNLGVIQSR